MSKETGKQEGQMGRWAPYYDLIMALMTLGREKKLRQMTIDLAQLKPGDRVLEIGSGTGTLTLAAKGRVGSAGEAVGIDIAPEMVAVASRKAIRKGVDVSFKVGSIAGIPFPEDRFDAVMCLHDIPYARRRKKEGIHRDSSSAETRWAPVHSGLRVIGQAL
jgi:ubiquinone/menaquinone biosynthesis C-methylase UbiE